MTAIASALELPALVLNRHWIPIHMTTARHALMLVYQQVARAVHPTDLTLHRFESWSDLRLPEGSPSVSTVRYEIAVPEIVVLEHYGRIPRRTVPFNRRNLFYRDHFMCQYCGAKDDPKELTIDHVWPRVRGGVSRWENCVIACIPCNRRKAHRPLTEAGMRLRKEPVRPRWTPRHLFAGIPRHATWERVIGEAYWNVHLDA